MLMKRVLSILLLFTAYCSFSQANESWRSYFSYNNVVDLSQSAERVYAAADVAVFSKHLQNGELKTITSVNGLKPETITTIHHSTAFNKTLIGNNNGLLLIVNADNTIVSRVDIIQETTVQSDRKKINHIYEDNGKAYLSCDFGIAVFDIAAMEFGDTYYMGPNGSEIPVLQTTVFNGYIYAACNNDGLRRAELANPNLHDFNQWEVFSGGYWNSIVVFNNVLTGGSFNNIYRFEGNNYIYVTSVTTGFVKLRPGPNLLVAYTFADVRVYNEQLQLQLQVSSIPNETVTFSSALVANGRLYIGTTQRGVFSTAVASPGQFDNITPNGPLMNRVWSLEKSANNLWAVFGGYNYFMAPDLSRYGISKLTGNGWLNIPYTDIANVKEAVSLSDIIVNPVNENQVYAASYHSGLLKLENDEPTVLYDDVAFGPGQSTLESLVLPPPNHLYRSIRIHSLAFDNNRNLWMTNSNILEPIKVLRADGQWASYSIEDKTSAPQNDHYSKMVIDKNNTKWIASRDNGVIGFNETMNNRFVIINNDTGLVDNYVRALAIDNRNQLWIGTAKGLRILRSIDRFADEDEPQVNSIIILEDGLAQELMYEQIVNDIYVDGANNKWLATAGAGAFLVSPDGQQTLFHFTVRNSPLPSNIIYDIEIDQATGEVFFATDKGLVSYLGTSTKASGDLNNVYVFPNPVRPGFEGDINISGLIDRANIKITDIEGNLVYETTTEGGTVLWNQRAFNKHKVASGVYMIFIASEDGSETKVKKVMIVR